MFFVGVSCFNVSFVFMLAMTWNVRGLGSREKRRFVRSLVYKHQPTVFILQETKLSSIDRGIISSLGGTILSRGMCVDANGLIGGLVTLWNDNFFLVKDCISNQRCIILVGVLLRINKEVVFCNVYTANVENERK